ncbi:MAG TPA: hypothetical protein PKM43_10755 [Verrucomicrobiota bacterium]|nr:hypothetical protein [Verrucomicrobiota bacterium]HRZ54450.1 hypothetical protein [Candidatus Paceibacterota bacterium]
MSLEIRRSSNWWYGVFVVNGRKTGVNLGVPITGILSSRLSHFGHLGTAFFSASSILSPSNLNVGMVGPFSLHRDFWRGA